jgi:hypothetical protein
LRPAQFAFALPEAAARGRFDGERRKELQTILAMRLTFD